MDFSALDHEVLHDNTSQISEWRPAVEEFSLPLEPLFNGETILSAMSVYDEVVWLNNIHFVRIYRNQQRPPYPALDNWFNSLCLKIKYGMLTDVQKKYLAIWFSDMDFSCNN